MWTGRLINMMLFKIKSETENQRWEKAMVLLDIIDNIIICFGAKDNIQKTVKLFSWDLNLL